ncbi:hypothetical protein BJ165DRAFT_1403464 [Panaeolus papilionaceus]|nr:hypothetical protein BJ165DRAFT_1403464 [Panaeolus papilionaceus]
MNSSTQLLKDEVTVPSAGFHLNNQVASSEKGPLQSDSSDPNNVPMLRVLFQSNRHSAATESENRPSHASITHAAAYDGSGDSSRDAEVLLLRDELREAKVKLLQANNDRKRLQSTVTSLQQELANVYTNVQSELGIWEEELLELRPFREEAVALRVANQFLEAQRQAAAKGKQNLQAEIEQLKRQISEGFMRSGDGADFVDKISTDVVGTLSSSSEEPSLALNDGQQRPRPDAGDLATRTVVSQARKLIRFNSNIYPEGIHGPRPDLTIGAAHGFFRLVLIITTPVQVLALTQSRNPDMTIIF